MRTFSDKCRIFYLLGAPDGVAIPNYRHAIMAEPEASRKTLFDAAFQKNHREACEVLIDEISSAFE